MNNNEIQGVIDLISSSDMNNRELGIHLALGQGMSKDVLCKLCVDHFYKRDSTFDTDYMLGDYSLYGWDRILKIQYHHEVAGDNTEVCDDYHKSRLPSYFKIMLNLYLDEQ